MVLGRTAPVGSKLYRLCFLALVDVQAVLSMSTLQMRAFAIECSKTHAGHFQDTLTRISLPSVLLSVRCGELKQQIPCEQCSRLQLSCWFYHAHKLYAVFYKC